MDDITSATEKLISRVDAYAVHQKSIQAKLTPEEWKALEDLVEAVADVGTAAVRRVKELEAGQ